VLRDLKVKLIDFGMSKLRKGSGKKEDLNTFCGTIDFISHEVIEGKSYIESTDIRSCGVSAFLLLSGIPPFTAKDDART